MANVIVMRVPKDKLQQEIEYKVLDGWKLRKKNEKHRYFNSTWEMGELTYLYGFSTVDTRNFVHYLPLD